MFKIERFEDSIHNLIDECGVCSGSDNMAGSEDVGGKNGGEESTINTVMVVIGKGAS